MGPPIDPFVGDEELPARADVVIVGAGIIGITAALNLAERGHSVLVCEKGVISGEQSSRNWGWCRQTGRDPRELPLIVEALREWRGMNERVGGETGFRECGILRLIEDESEMAGFEDFLDYARPFQLSSRKISAAEAKALVPGASREWAGGLFTPTDGRAEPQKATVAIARAAQAKGAAIVTNCAVRGFETAAGAVAEVVTERGSVKTNRLVIAAGAWSRLFCQRHGIGLPQLKVIGSAFRTEPVEGGPEVSATAKGFAFRKRLDGGYTIALGGASIAPIVPDSFRFFWHFLPALRSEWDYVRPRFTGQFFEELATPKRWRLDEKTPFEKTRVLDPKPTRWIVEQAEANIKQALPAFKDARIAQAWAGAIDVMPDAVPVISDVEAQPGLIVATGFSGHGFGIGPGAGRLVADLATGAAPVVDPRDFRLSRFFDGSRPRPIAGM